MIVGSPDALRGTGTMPPMFGPALGTTIGLVNAAPVAFAARVAVENESDLASSRLSMVIAGLIGLAVVLTISTIVFWRATRPDRPGGGEIGIRWIQPGQSAATPASPSTPAPAADEASGADYGALRARPADG